MTGHTPGPWALLPQRDGDGDIVRVVQADAPPPGFHVAYVYGHGGDLDTDTNRTANAHLIAAAPDLLEVCRNLLLAWDEWEANERRGPFSPPINAARSAIRKARGEE